MAVLKELKRVGVVVFVDSNSKSEDYKAAPQEVSSKLQKVSGSLPIVALTSADMTQDFGSFAHKQLKSQDFRKIFKDAKKKIREAKKAGSLAALATATE